MGYTHYYEVQDSERNAKAFNIASVHINDVLKRYKDILADGAGEKNTKPVLTEDTICFNGIDEDSHETFWFSIKNPKWEFCKTARKPYDDAVCEILLILKFYLGSTFTFSSDGIGDEKEQSWLEAEERVLEIYGVRPI